MTLFETSVSSLPLYDTAFGVEYVIGNDEYIIADMDVFCDFIALYERSSVDGRHRIRLKRRIGVILEEDIIIPLPHGTGDCAILSSGGNMYYESTSLCFRIESPCSAGRTYSFDTTTGQVQPLGSEAVKVPYVEKRVFVTSADGTHVPMSIFRLDDDAMDNENRHPAVLIGYGAYGEPVVYGFDPTIVPLLNRGFVIAYAHTRGGGELGRAWYRAGRLDQKQRVIEDFIACAEALVGPLGISESQMLTAKAFSAGAVTVAGAVNRQPSLFGSVVLTNPFLDVGTSMWNKELALTEHEWNEWGNAIFGNNAAKSISSYCPMSNVTQQNYPQMLLVGTIDDANVPYWHPLTFCLKVRKAFEALAPTEADNREITDRRALLHIEESGGHQLHGTKVDVTAMEAAFIVGCHKNSLD
jgi:oligopeptidase B